MENEIVWDDYDLELSVDEIQRIEIELGVKFPGDYVSCVRKYNGGYPDKDIFDVPNRGRSVFDRLLSFQEDSPIYIMNIYNAMSDRLPVGVYPFAEDPFGNSICFDYRNDTLNPSIVFWDHELAFVNPEKGIFQIFFSFTELLSRLYME